MVGNPLVVSPGYLPNEARLSGADIDPVHIVPWRFENFQGYGAVQLHNGWDLTSYGRKDQQMTYRSLLSSSQTGPGHNFVLPGQKQQPHNKAMPSQLRLQRMEVPASSRDSDTGFLAPGVNLSRRRFYG